MSTLLFVTIRKNYSLSLSFPNFRNEINKKILKYSAFDSILGFVDQTIIYAQRFIIINSLSVISLGIYSAAKALQSRILIASNSSLFYFRSQMCEEMTCIERSKRLNDFLYLTLYVNILLFAFGLIFIEDITTILLSKKFVDISGLFLWFSLAAVINNINVGYMFTIVGMAKLKIHGLGIVVGGFTGITIAYLMIGTYGLISLPIGTTVGAIARIAIGASYLGVAHKVYAYKKTIILAVIGIITLLVVNLFIYSKLELKILCAVVISIIWYMILSSKNKRLLIDLIRNKIGKK